MVDKNYVPDSGDIVGLTFDPKVGNEQSGRCPAIVLTSRSYNIKTNLAIFCPITSKQKGYPFEVILPENLKISGVILSDQIRSLDWKVRKTTFIDKISEETFQELKNLLSSLLEL
jgi:mRNA interferase MazF